jgi:hypothetical protein
MGSHEKPALLMISLYKAYYKFNAYCSFCFLLDCSSAHTPTSLTGGMIMMVFMMVMVKMKTIMKI